MKSKTVVTSLLFAASFCVHASPEQPTEGINALDQNKPKIEFTYSCMDYPAVTESLPNNQCLEKFKALKRIQCRADWLLRQELIDYYECGEKYSTGDFKAYFKNKADATRDFIQRNR